MGNLHGAWLMEDDSNLALWTAERRARASRSQGEGARSHHAARGASVGEHLQPLRLREGCDATGGKINGFVAAHTHGPAEWWVLVEKDGTRGESSEGGKGTAKGNGKNK